MAEPLHVLFVVDGLWVGGTERSLADLLPRLREVGARVEVACFRHCEEGVEAEVLAAGFEVHFLTAPGRRARIAGLRALIRDSRPDIVHAMLFESNLVSRLAAWRQEVILVNSLVSTSYDPARLAHDPSVRRGRLRIVQAVDALSSRLVDHFHAVSETAKRSAERHLRIPAKRFTVVRRGRDAARYVPPSAEAKRAARRRLGLPEDAALIVHTGRQDAVKRQGDIIEALALLGDEPPRRMLAVAGREGSASPELERLVAARDLGERVRFLGHLDDVTELLAVADVFVFPSIYEGMPGSVIEAMAMGLPIVASRIPAVEEIVEEGGNALLVPPRDPRALASAIEQVLADPERARAMGRRGRELFEENLTLERYTERMLTLYRRLLARPAST